MNERDGNAAMMQSGTGGVVLCADDYAMTNGISRAIIELAEAGALSAASAMTTSPHWPSHATWLARARGHIATGLHLNLTLGAPLGASPELAPQRRFYGIGDLTRRAVLGMLNRAELRAEIERQIGAFEAEMGFAPDHIDGHQHVHALPVIRSVLLEVLVERYGGAASRPLLRDPAEPVAAIIPRRRAAAKAVTLATLSAGFGSAARAAGFSCNDGFSGVTDFAEGQVGADFKAACTALGPRPMVMCHPGFVDDELLRLDRVTERRQREFDVLMRGQFPLPIWRPQRSVSGDPIDWTTCWVPTP